MPAGGTAPARANHPVLLPEADLDDELPRPTRRPRWYEPLAKPAAYIAAGLAGALLVTALSVVMGARFGSPRANRVVVDSAPDPQLQLMSAATLDRRAGSFSLAPAGFSFCVGMYDTRRLGGAGVGGGLPQN